MREKHSSLPYCIKKDCPRDERVRSLSGYPYCWRCFFWQQENQHIWYWITWHVWRKHFK